MRTHSAAPPPVRSGGRFAALAPGILIAATGVGAGDLLTAGLAGSALGVQILWAAWVGALLKCALNEGLARWQMATGTTLLEGWVQRLGAWIQWVFLAYLLVWSIAVGGALTSACGAAGAALWPVGGDLVVAKRLWGIVHALAAVVLVRLGGFRLFSRMMAACIAVMFVAVITTAVLARPPWPKVVGGMLWPAIPDDGGLAWVLGVLGGVGGTVTLLSYGYWIRECGRSGRAGLAACRLDLAVGYGLTALFGMAMIVIGSRISVERGPSVALDMARELEGVLGPAGRWIFLCGFWGAVFSSMLGVWQGVPYLFADFVRLRRGHEAAAGGDLAETRAYRGYLLAIAILPLPLLWVRLQTVQLLYAVGGALFMPLLALTLLKMNRREAWVGRAFRNRAPATALLLLTLGLFGWMGWLKLLSLAD